MYRLDRENRGQVGYRPFRITPHVNVQARFAETQPQVGGVIMILNPRPEARLGMTGLDQGSMVCGAKRTATAQKIDRFQYRGLAGAVVTGNDIDPGMKAQR